MLPADYEQLLSGLASTVHHYFPLQDEDGSSPVRYGDANAVTSFQFSQYEVDTGLTPLGKCVKDISANGDGLDVALPVGSFSFTASNGYYGGVIAFAFKLEVNDAGGAYLVQVREGAGSNNTLTFAIDASLGLYLRNGTLSSSSTYTISLDTWYLVYLERAGNNFSLYINGNKTNVTVSSGTDSYNRLMTTGIVNSGKSTVCYLSQFLVLDNQNHTYQGTNRILYGLGHHNDNSLLDDEIILSQAREYFTIYADEVSGGRVYSRVAPGTAPLFTGSPVFNQDDPFGGTDAVRLQNDGDLLKYFISTSSDNYAVNALGAWVKVNAWDDPDGVILMMDLDTGSPTTENCIKLRRDGSTDNIVIGNRALKTAGNFTITLGEWYFMVFGANVSTDQVLLYVDGVKVIDETLTNYRGLSTYRQFGGTDQLNENVDLTLARLAVWNAIPTQQMVTDIWDARNGDAVVLSLPITWQTQSVNLFLPINWIDSDPKTLSLPITWQTESVDLSLPIIWYLSEPKTLSLPITWESPNTASYPLAVDSVQLAVVIGQVDFSDDLVPGNVSVEYRENASAIAEFSILHAAGSFNEMSYLDQAVSIRSIDGSGNVSIFTGRITDAEFVPGLGIIDFTCTNDLQGYFDNQSRDGIDAIIPAGHWSEHVFQPDSSGWNYCLDRLSTVYSGLTLDINGIPVVYSLESKVTPDRTFNSGSVYDVSPMKRARRRDLVNRVRLVIEYRYSRLRQRHLMYSISHDLQPCDYVANQHGLPSRAELEGVIEQAGWTVINKQYFNIESGLYVCSGGRVLRFTNSNYDTTFTSARLTIGRRFAQTITEQYQIDVRADDSIEFAGEVGIENNFAVEHKCNAVSWETGTFDTVFTGAVQDASGDYIYDVIDADNHRTSVFDPAMVCAQAVGVNTIKQSHRLNEQSFKVPYLPAVTLGETHRLTVQGIDVTGVVKAFVHRFENNTYYTEITLAVSQHGGSGLVTDTALGAVAAPDIDPGSYQSGCEFGYHIGGESGSVADDGSLLGALVNRESSDGVYPQYQEQLRIQLPAIAPEHRDPLTITKSVRHDVAIPADPLTLTA